MEEVRRKEEESLLKYSSEFEPLAPLPARPVVPVALAVHWLGLSQRLNSRRFSQDRYYRHRLGGTTDVQSDPTDWSYCTIARARPEVARKSPRYYRCDFTQDGRPSRYTR